MRGGFRGPNIDVAGAITLTVAGADSEIQIEESNHMDAGLSISITGGGAKSQVQTKKGVTLVAGVDITISALGFESEVQSEESNKYTAVGIITLETGAAGKKLEVKKLSDFDAATIDIIPGGSFCRIEGGTGLWTGAISTGTCSLI